MISIVQDVGRIFEVDRLSVGGRSSVGAVHPNRPRAIQVNPLPAA